MKKMLLASIVAGLLCVATTPAGASAPILTSLTKHENVLARHGNYVGHGHRHAYYYYNNYPYDYYYYSPGYYYYDPYYYSPYGSVYFWW